RGLDLGAKEHAVRSLLSGRPARVPALLSATRPEPSEVKIPAGNRPVYAGKLLWPTNLTFFYPHWKIDPAVWWQWLFPAGVLAVVIGLVFVARRYRGPLAGFLIFCGTLFPVLGFLNIYPFRYSYVADHFQYLASLGIIVPVASV